MKPGEEMIVQGIADLKAGLETIPSLIVSIGGPRLRNAGLKFLCTTSTTPNIASTDF